VMMAIRDGNVQNTALPASNLKLQEPLAV